MKQIEVRVWIDRPVEEVYAYVVDVDRWPEWRADVIGRELLTEGPIRVGTRARGIARVLGRPLTIDVEVTAMEPGVRFGYRRNLAGLKAALETQPTQLRDEATQPCSAIRPVTAPVRRRRSSTRRSRGEGQSRRHPSTAVAARPVTGSSSGTPNETAEPEGLAEGHGTSPGSASGSRR